MTLKDQDDYSEGKRSQGILSLAGVTEQPIVQGNLLKNTVKSKSPDVFKSRWLSKIRELRKDLKPWNNKTMSYTLCAG